MEHTYFFAVDLGATSGRTILGCLGASSYGEAYTQLFTKYNKMISKANAVNMADLDVTEKK